VSTSCVSISNPENFQSRCKAQKRKRLQAQAGKLCHHHGVAFIVASIIYNTFDNIFNNIYQYIISKPWVWQLLLVAIIRSQQNVEKCSTKMILF